MGKGKRQKKKKVRKKTLEEKKEYPCLSSPAEKSSRTLFQSCSGLQKLPLKIPDGIYDLSVSRKAITEVYFTLDNLFDKEHHKNIRKM